MTARWLPGTLESDLKKINPAIQQIGNDVDTNTTAIATLNAATYVNSIAGNHGAFTLNATSGITNSTNDIVLSQASSSQFGAIKVDGTSITASSGVISAVITGNKIAASLGADVTLNNTSNYFDGPSIAQGSTGVWLASGQVTVADTAGVADFFAKLWDGTTVISSGWASTSGASFGQVISLSGYISSPAANIRISVRCPGSTTAKILFNKTGTSKDSTISAFRIA